MDKVTKEKLELARLKKIYTSQLNSCFTHSDVNSKATGAQKEFLEDIQDVTIRWAVCDNRSGKTGTAAREASWIFQNTHPFFTRPKPWGDGPILMIILGKKIEQMQTAIWEQQIKPFLEPGTFKEKYGSSGLEKITNLKNGNMIIFQSHNNPEEARKNVQGYDAHWVWVDEMPESDRLIAELTTRLVSVDGRMLATFTPLVFNVKIKLMVERAALPIAKKYHFSIYENPANMAIGIDKVIATIKEGCASIEEFEARVGGKWIAAGNRVSCYSPNKHKAKPERYDPLVWRHIVSVDPSASGKTGLVIIAEDPADGIWYVMKSKYMDGDAAFILVEEVEKEIAGRNISLRVCDSNPAGFYKEAARRSITYRTVADIKANAKHDLINNANTILAEGRAVLTEGAEILEDELIQCVWSETNPDKIVNGSRFHTFDAFQYALANLLKFDGDAVVKRTPEEALFHRVRKAKEKKNKDKLQQAYRIMQKKQHRRAKRQRRAM